MFPLSRLLYLGTWKDCVCVDIGDDCPLCCTDGLLDMCIFLEAGYALESDILMQTSCRLFIPDMCSIYGRAIMFVVHNVMFMARNIMFIL